MRRVPDPGSWRQALPVIKMRWPEPLEKKKGPPLRRAFPEAYWISVITSVAGAV